MSLLRDVLKRNNKGADSPGGFSPLSSKRNLKSYASSIKSTGGASMRSIAESVFSFYSVVTGGGPRIPKRRRADFSRLGVPEWHANDPPPAASMPGTAPPSEAPPYTTAHSTVMHATDKGVEPWLASCSIQPCSCCFRNADVSQWSKDRGRGSPGADPASGI
ncbi:hypothetical protein C8F01DRAFT_488376 [Mycena amicta]|nr:hypothetical protein C8F01DRAFT_488376 [Mycena amicta]